MGSKPKAQITNQNTNAVCSFTEAEEGGILFWNLQMTFDEVTVPKPVAVKWYYSGADCCFTWNPSGVHNLGCDWGKSKIDSRLASWMPIHSVISPKGMNKLHIAVSDADTPMCIGTGVREEDATLECEVLFFTAPIAPVKEYQVRIRLDMREIPYYDSIYETVEWWESRCGYTSAPVPESAKLPMDSLWYSFHQQLDVQEILKECQASKEIGMDTVIIDDGWQTEDNNRGYAFCGDWQAVESKMGNMADLVENIHQIGMKVMLWYSVPFVGIYSQKYAELKDYCLDSGHFGGSTFCLDPRYKKVRDYLSATYQSAVRDWKLDGLKLDFIDSFALRGKSLEYDPAREVSSLEDGIHALMTEVQSALTAINPDILIEFRQSYVGPAIRKYGNMLRVGDCPADMLRNRRGIINLRLTSGKTAVHSDMLMWNFEDSTENAALQIANVLYGVPQISVRVDRLPESHRKMLTHYIRFWRENREVLLEGKLIAENPENNYSLVCATLGGRSVFTVYTNPVVTISTAEAIVVNASGYDSLVIKNASGRRYCVVDCMGNTVGCGTVVGTLEEISVPVAGVLTLKSGET